MGKKRLSAETIAAEADEFFCHYIIPVCAHNSTGQVTSQRAFLGRGSHLFWVKEWVVTFFQPTIDQTHTAFYNDAPNAISITGVVAAEPDVRDYYLNLRLRVDAVELADESLPVHGLVLVCALHYPECGYGDRLTVSGKLETPPVLKISRTRKVYLQMTKHSAAR